MLSGVFEGAVGLFIALVGGIYVIGQIKSNAERNAADIEAIKVMMHEFQEDMKALIERNLNDVKGMIDSNKETQRESLEREVSHIKDILNICFAGGANTPVVYKSKILEIIEAWKGK